MDKQDILDEIRRIAGENGGQSVGKKKFRQLTGIKESDWIGKYWVRWSDAVKEVGLSPGSMQSSFSDDYILEKYASLVNELGHVPTSPELRMKARNDADFPSHNTFSRYGSKKRLIGELIGFCQKNGRFSHLLESLVKEPHELAGLASEDDSVKDSNDGYVYLMKFGDEYKIGTSNNVERRFRELKTQMPYEGKIIHTIVTGDPEGIEAYWHQYFSDKRLKGEWFKLNSGDIKYFKRRKLM